MLHRVSCLKQVMFLPPLFLQAAQSTVQIQIAPFHRNNFGLQAPCL